MRQFALLVIFLAACRQPAKTNTIENEHLVQEINKRIETISLSPKGDSLTTYLYDIKRETDNLVLLSKDVENISAAINKSNTYFETAAEKYQVESDFLLIDRTMPINDVETAIRKNELNLLNKFIFKNNISAGMVTAQ